MKYRSEKRLQTAHDNLRYARELVREQVAIDEQLAPAPPPPVCESFRDHRFDPAEMAAPTVQCTRCGQYFENPTIFHAG